MKLTIVDHPLAAERLTRLRDEKTTPIVFRRVLKELSEFLIYEATRDIVFERIDVKTPLRTTQGVRIDQPPLIVPVLRAALGMLDAALTLLPTAHVGFLGMRRNEETFEAEPYLQTVPSDLNGQPILLLDPMLATGGSLVHACEVVKDCGAGDITIVCALAAPEGIERTRQAGLASHVVTASVDEGLNEHAYIVPGLGDAGDRQFGGL
ncbi:MAG: uracil phosphoribosyltransferase [Polyangiales bacterium]